MEPETTWLTNYSDKNREYVGQKQTFHSWVEVIERPEKEEEEINL